MESCDDLIETTAPAFRRDSGVLIRMWTGVWRPERRVESTSRCDPVFNPSLGYRSRVGATAPGGLVAMDAENADDGAHRPRNPGE
jgi:hypothetical protein